MTLRVFISVVLALMLALSSHTVAAARGATDPVGHMVLCIGSKSVTVYTDAQGKPTQAPHFCPDCAIGADFVHTSPHVTIPQQPVSARGPCTLSALCVSLPKGFVPQTRAPPFAV